MDFLPPWRLAGRERFGGNDGAQSLALTLDGSVMHE